MKKLTAILMALILTLSFTALAEETPAPTADTPESTSNILVVYFSATGNTETAANLIAEATGADVFKLEPAQMMEKTRKQNVAFPRQVAMYLASVMIPHLSLKEIAEYYNRKDHTTVLHAKKMIDKQFGSDEEFRAQVELIMQKIQG